MNNQRFAVALVAIIGIVATFLPWYDSLLHGVESGMASSGWFTFVMFAFALVLTMRKNIKEDMSMGIAYGVSVLGLIASFVVLWRLIDIWFAKEGALELGGDLTGTAGKVMVEYGAYVVVAAGICIPFAAFLFKSKFRRD